jgi:Family of unknown function (DUF5955)
MASDDRDIDVPDIDIDDFSQIVRLGGTSPAVVDALDRLERLLGQHANSLAEPDEARQDLAAVREEAGRAERDDGRLADALRRLAGHVTAVAVLAEAVRQLGTQLER